MSFLGLAVGSIPRRERKRFPQTITALQTVAPIVAKRAGKVAINTLVRAPVLAGFAGDVIGARKGDPRAIGRLGQSAVDVGVVGEETAQLITTGEIDPEEGPITQAAIEAGQRDAARKGKKKNPNPGGDPRTRQISRRPQPPVFDIEDEEDVVSTRAERQQQTRRPVVMRPRKKADNIKPSRKAAQMKTQVRKKAIKDVKMRRI